MELTTLIRLSKNPHYKMTPEEVKQLEDYRKQDCEKKRKKRNMQHGSSFDIHYPYASSRDEANLRSERDKRHARGTKPS